MKSPEEYSEELVKEHLPWVAGADRYNMGELHHPYIAKQLAIITIDRIIEAIPVTFQKRIEYYQKAKEHLKTKL